jgi:predicted aspartyl protease
LYDTDASVTLITPQTFEHACQNSKVGKKWSGHRISIKNANGGAMEITSVYTVHFLIDGRDMEPQFIVMPEASSNIIGMNVIRTYKLKMDVLTTTVTALLAHVASLQTSEEYNVKVHTDINVEAGMSHLTKLFLADKKSGKRLFLQHKFMVTIVLGTLLGIISRSTPVSVRELNDFITPKRECEQAPSAHGTPPASASRFP